MDYQFLLSTQIRSLRNRLLGEAGAAGKIDDPFLVPVEDLVERLPEKFRVLDHRDPFIDSEGKWIVPHFGLVMKGYLPWAHYLELENRFVAVMRQIWRRTPSFVAQVSVNLSPSSERGLRRYCDRRQLDLVTALFGKVREKGCNIIQSEDPVLFDLLVRLGIREIAMHVFVFPELGLCIDNHWDMRQLLFSKHDAVWREVDRMATEEGLLVRALSP